MGNEGKSAQRRLLSNVVRAHKDANSPKVRAISDGEKGFVSVLNEIMSLASQLLDKGHKRDALRKLKGGREASKAYDQCFQARTVQEIESIKSKMSPVARATLEKNADANLFPCVKGGFFGFECGPYIESFNKQLSEHGIRDLHAPLQAREFMEMVCKTFAERKAEALACKKKLPPRIQAVIDIAKVAARDLPTSSINFRDDAKMQGTVKDIKNPNILYAFDLLQLSNCSLAACSCGVVQSTGLPCVHCCAAARAGSNRIEDYVAPLYRTDAWKEQYANVVCTLPSQADIEKHEHLFNPRLKLPPLLKKPKGRPRNNLRTRTYMDDLKEGKGSKKRPVTCRACFKRGHTKRKCPFLKEANSF